MSDTLIKDFYRIDLDDYAPGYKIKLVKTDGTSFESAPAIELIARDTFGNDVTASLFQSYSFPTDQMTADSLVMQFTLPTDTSLIDKFTSYSITIAFAGETIEFEMWFCDSDVDNIDFIPYRHRLTSEVVNKPLRELRDGVKHSFCKISELEENLSTSLTIDASVDSGTYHRTLLSVKLVANDVNASVYYELTSDDTEPATPAAGSSLYSSALDLTVDPGSTKTYRLKAIAIKGGVMSAVGSWQYVLDDQALTVSAAPAFGTYATPQTITLSASDATAGIRYTTDGTAPTAFSGTVYDGPFTLNDGTYTFKAIAYTGTGKTSDVLSGTYVINTASLVIHSSLANGSTYVGDSTTSTTVSVFEGVNNVTANCSTLKYTTDGSDPSLGTDLASPYSVDIDTTGATSTLKVYAEKDGKTATATFSFTRQGAVITPEVEVRAFDPSSGTTFVKGSSDTNTIKVSRISYTLADGTTGNITGTDLDDPTIDVGGTSCYAQIYINIDAPATTSDYLIDYASGYELPKMPNNGDYHTVYAFAQLRKNGDDSIYVPSSSSELIATYYYGDGAVESKTIEVGVTVTNPSAQTDPGYCAADRTVSFTGQLYDGSTAGSDVSSDSGFSVNYTIYQRLDGGDWDGGSSGTWHGGDPAITLATTDAHLNGFKVYVDTGDATYTGGYQNVVETTQIVTADARHNIPLLDGDTSFIESQVVTIAKKYDAPDAGIYYAFADPGHTPSSSLTGWTAYPPSQPSDPGYNQSANGIYLDANTTIYAALTKNLNGSDYQCPDSDETTQSQAYTKEDSSLTVVYKDTDDNLLASPYKVKHGVSTTVVMHTEESDGVSTKYYKGQTSDIFVGCDNCGGSSPADEDTEVDCPGFSDIESAGTNIGTGGSISISGSDTNVGIYKICGAAEDTSQTNHPKGTGQLKVWFCGLDSITGSANVIDCSSDVTIPGGKFINNSNCQCYEWVTGSGNASYIMLKGLGMAAASGITEAVVGNEPAGFSLAWEVVAEDTVYGSSTCLKFTPTAPKDSSESAHYSFDVPLACSGCHDSFELYVKGGAAISADNLSNACGLTEMKYSRAVEVNNDEYHIEYQIEDGGVEHDLPTDRIDVMCGECSSAGKLTGCTQTHLASRTIYVRFFGNGIDSVAAKTITRTRITTSTCTNGDTPADDDLTVGVGSVILSDHCTDAPHAKVPVTFTLKKNTSAAWHSDIVFQVTLVGGEKIDSDAVQFRLTTCCAADC